MAHTRNRNSRRKKVSKLRIFLMIILASVVGVGLFVAKAATTLPQWDPTDLTSQKQASIVYDKDGNQIAQLYASENRITTKSGDIPELVKKTFVAVEDKRFYSHIGIDPSRIASSAIHDILSGSAKEGASTITQQLARNAFIQDPTAKTLTRKIQEAIMAVALEHKYTKDEILTFYLNKIFLGESSYGIQAAAKTYFGKDLNQLDPAEVAMLAGMPQAPSAYDPYYHPDEAKNRRAIVLGVMRDSGIITADDYTKYKDEPFTYVDMMKQTYGGAKKAVATTSDYKFPYFVDYVITTLENNYNLTPEQIYNGGLKIYTTVDPKIQSAAEAAFKDSANFPKSVDSTLVQGAMTVLDPTNGSLRAIVGGRDYTPMGLNRATQSQRQPGSTIKPLVVYGPAIEKGGYFPGTVLDDEPVSYNGGNGMSWSPKDFDTESAGWKGRITMRFALEDSVNVYAVKLLNLIGVNNGWQFGKNLGLPLTEKDKVLSLALGTPQVTTLNMASAYGAYADNGVSVTPHAFDKVIDSSGAIVVAPQISKNRVMKPTTAYIINDMLRSVVTNGTAYAAQIGNWAVAGKTGTTSLDPQKYGNKTGNPDAWFAGYTPSYVGIVWMGYDSDPDGKHYLHQVFGGGYPAQLWKKVMTAALEGTQVQTEFQKPDGIVSGQIDTKSGLLPSSLTPSQFIQTEIAANGDFPTEVSNVWVKNSSGGLILNLPDRSSSADWPSDEAPYRPSSNAIIPSETPATDPNNPSTTTDPNAPQTTTPADTSPSPSGTPTTGQTPPQTGTNTGQTTSPTEQTKPATSSSPTISTTPPVKSKGQ